MCGYSSPVPSFFRTLLYLFFITLERDRRCGPAYRDQSSTVLIRVLELYLRAGEGRSDVNGCPVGRGIERRNILLTAMTAIVAEVVVPALRLYVSGAALP